MPSDPAIPKAIFPCAFFRVAAPVKAAGTLDVFEDEKVDEAATGAVEVVKPVDPLLMATEAAPDGPGDPDWLAAEASEPLEIEPAGGDPEAELDCCEVEPAAAGDDAGSLGEDSAGTPVDALGATGAADVASASETGTADETTSAPWTG